MAKGSSNPMEDYNRKKRKKAVQKNKEQRIKARDEKVVETKSVTQVEEEIRTIKRRKNLQLSEQQKLQRLEKELKLVKAAKESQPKEQQQFKQEPSRPLTELDDPRKSVYYDERMNPYGAPPPGKPRLYHQRGGGVTMDVRHAAVPGEEPPPPPPPPRPPPPPPPPRSAPSSARTREPQVNHNRSSHSSNNKERSPQERQKTSPPASETIQSKKSEPAKTTKEELNHDQPLVVPILPAASKAVQRSRKGKTDVDIWASNEEVDYERRANQVDLEADDIGAAAPKNPKAKKKKPPLEIFYQDQSGQVQGPFSKAQMQGWVSAGFFPPTTTMVKTNRNETWIPMAELQALQPDPPKLQEENSAQSRIAALKKQDSSVEERILALKKKETTVEDRIAALKQTDQASNDQEDDGPSTIQERIAAMRAAQAPEEIVDDENGAVPLPPPPPPVPSNVPDPQGEPPAYPMDDEYDVPAYPVDDTADPYVEGGGEMGPAPPYPVDDVGDDSPGVAPYPSAEEPPAYPVDDDDDAYPGVAPYPSAEEPPAYPVDDDGEAYPADNDEQNVPYPVNDTYPIHDDEETPAYPVTDSYPVTDDYPATGDYVGEENALEPGENAPVYPKPPPETEKPKKTIKVDKEVIAFLPSNLQSRKRKPSTQTSAKPKKVKAAPVKAPRDDYDKLMDEIDDL